MDISSVVHGRLVQSIIHCVQKKNYPAVKIHPGKFEDEPGNFLAIRSINVRNVAKKFKKKTKNLPIILA